MRRVCVACASSAAMAKLCSSTLRAMSWSADRPRPAPPLRLVRPGVERRVGANYLPIARAVVRRLPVKTA